MLPSTDPPIFDFENLSSVVPVRQTRAFAAGTLTVASLELNTAGFIANLWLELDAAADPYAHWTTTASDDRGNRYMARMRAGAGGGMPGGGFQYHMVRMFTPALDPAATTLSFEVRAVQGNIPFVEGVGHTYPAEDVLGGPWVVDVPLQPAPPEAAVGMYVDDSPCPDFSVADLWRVVPVGQQQVVNDFALTLYSIELFRCAFILVVRTDYPAERAPSPDPHVWVGRDERGREYRGYDMSGSGGGIFGQHTTWRMDYRFRPALDPAAQRLSLSLDYAGSRPPPNPDGLYGTIVGPWNFEVDLT